MPGSERMSVTKNGRPLVKCVCASCGATKSRFVRKKYEVVKSKFQSFGVI